MTKINFSTIAVQSYKSALNRLLQTETKKSVAQFITEEKYRRSIIGYFTTRSLGNLTDFLNDNPNIRDFILDFSDLFFFNLQEEFFTSNVLNKMNTGVEVKYDKDAFDVLLEFISRVLKPNRASIDKEPNAGVIIGYEVYTTFYQDVGILINDIKVNAWVIPYYILFMNLDALDAINSQVMSDNAQ